MGLKMDQQAYYESKITGEKRESLGFKLQLSQLKTQWHGKWRQSKLQLRPAAKTFKTYAEKTNRENCIGLIT